MLLRRWRRSGSCLWTRILTWGATSSSREDQPESRQGGTERALPGRPPGPHRPLNLLACRGSPREARTSSPIWPESWSRSRPGWAHHLQQGGAPALPLLCRLPRGHRPAGAEDELLAAVLGPERLAEPGLSDWVQLTEVLRACRCSRSLAEAGRRLFAASQQKKKVANDADRFSSAWRATGWSGAGAGGVERIVPPLRFVASLLSDLIR
jgi:hypothetical protein